MKRRFEPQERWAIFVTHGERCYMCRKPIDLASMEVDHILPESLAEPRLGEVLAAYGLLADFDLNSYLNLLPACGPCNLKKRNSVFEVTPLIQGCLADARAGAEQVHKVATETVSRPKVQRALMVLTQALKAGDLPIEEFDELKSLHDELHNRPQRDTKGRYIEEASFAVEAELRLAPGYTITRRKGHLAYVERNGVTVGYTTTHPHPDWSWYCPSCGMMGPWQGARCMSCGMMSDD